MNRIESYPKLTIDIVKWIKDYYFYNNIDPYEIYDRDFETLDIDFKNLSTNYCPKISFLEIEIDKEIAHRMTSIHGNDIITTP